MTEVRVRLAPSPTGNLHVGTARTALFNYLFAKAHQGTFILRIEDTDLERSKPEFEDDIFNGLRLLGLELNEGPNEGGDFGPYRQSQRLETYPTYAQQLLDAGKAYHCYCTQDELDAEKQQAMADKRNFVYSGRCRDPQVQEQLKQDSKRKPTVRFHIPEPFETLVMTDIIRKEVSFDTSLIGDFVIMKSDGTPTYNFACVVDDILMHISHVIRGEDHISNTPKQILLYRALGSTEPTFAHCGMILAPDRSKLSKRHGATSVADFIEQGYLPEAFCNFLSLLGWSPGEDNEVGSLAEFGQLFQLERVSQSPAIFDQEKLDWLNGQYIRLMPTDVFQKKAHPHLSQYNLAQYPQEKLNLLWDAARERLTKLSDITETVSYFFQDSLAYDDPTCQETLAAVESHEVLQKFQTDFLPQAPFENLDALGTELKTFAKGLSPLKMKAIMWAIRSATTGRVHGIDLALTLYILGQDTLNKRVTQALTSAKQQV